MLASRIDRLAREEKELLQTLAVIGKEFRLSLIRKVAGRADDDLERMLSELQLAEFIYEQPAVSDVEYTFKHALTLEVASGSLLSERRTEVHRRVVHLGLPVAVAARIAARDGRDAAELARARRSAGPEPNRCDSAPGLCSSGEP